MKQSTVPGPVELEVQQGRQSTLNQVVTTDLADCYQARSVYTSQSGFSQNPCPTVERQYVCLVKSPFSALHIHLSL
ncbi:hypothetical protein STEG23_008685 [Scotinomys teguina]